ncbi:MAG: hypothetical protein WC100_20830 [Sterolibacterium sp.]
MALPQRYRRNLERAGNEFTKSTGRATEKAAVGVFKWATTDHLGMGNAIINMPKMGLLESIQYVLWEFLIRVFAAIVLGIGIFVVIAYGIPLLLG